jgi:hypothetical protein
MGGGVQTRCVPGWTYSKRSAKGAGSVCTVAVTVTPTVRRMNKKRKILTLVALAVFGVIIALHYSWIPIYIHSRQGVKVLTAEELKERRESYMRNSGGETPPPWNGEWWTKGYFKQFPALIKDVRMPVFVLGVFYGGVVRYPR